MLTLDLIQEEDIPSPRRAVNPSPDCPRSKTDVALSARTGGASGKSHSLPREVAAVWEKAGPAHTPQPGKRLTSVEKDRCASMDEILTHPETKAVKKKTVSCSPTSTGFSAAASVSQLQQLIHRKLEKTEQLLKEVRGTAEGEAGERGRMKGKEAPEAERLLKEATVAWSQAQEVLEEVKELRALCQQLHSPLTPSDGPTVDPDRPM